MLAWLSMAASKLDQSFVAAATEGPGGTRTQRRAPTAHESMVGATAASMIVKPVGNSQRDLVVAPHSHNPPRVARARSVGRSVPWSLYLLDLPFLHIGHAVPRSTRDTIAYNVERANSALQPLSPAAKLQQLSGLLLGSTFIQDERAWELLCSKEADQENLQDGGKFADIAAACHVAPSLRDGVGLFASKDLPVDTVVSFYPVHSIGLMDQRLASNADDQDYWRGCTTAFRMPLAHATVQEFAPGTFVDVNLQKADRAGWLAHRANDATTCVGPSETEILSYLHTCALECNCVLVPFGGAAPILALVTTRDVSEGEELLHSYGLEHWELRREEEEAFEAESGEEPTEPNEDEAAEPLSEPARLAVEAFRAEQEREDRLESLRERYLSEIETFEGMIVLAAEQAEQQEKERRASWPQPAPRPRLPTGGYDAPTRRRPRPPAAAAQTSRRRRRGRNGRPSDGARACYSRQTRFVLR